MDRKKQGTNTTKHLLELAAFTGSLILCRVRVGDSCAPFGLASMAAAELTGIDPLFAGAGVVVGAFLSGEPLWGVMIAAAAFVLLTRLMKVVVGPVPSSARMLVFLLCEIAVLPFEMVLTWRSSAYALLALALSAVAVVLMQRCWTLLRHAGRLAVLQEKEQLMLSAFLGLLLLGMGDFAVGGISLPVILLDVYVLILVFTKGPEGLGEGILTAALLAFALEEGALLLDPTGEFQPGVPFAPPEGDAGTGMAATNSVRVRTGNVSAGTSDFAMIVTDRALGVHREIDMVTTPDGLPVAMVHCNNCTSDINSWVGLFSEFCEMMGIEAGKGELFTKLFNKALEGEEDCGGLLSFNYFSGEGVTDLDEGRPVFARSPDAKFTLANFMRTHLLSALATLKIGLDILTQTEQVEIDKLYGHGGFFKTPEVGQRMLSAAVGASVSVMETAGEGGPYGMALLGAYMLWKDAGESLPDYLDHKVFAGAKASTLMAEEREVAGFDRFLQRYRKALPLEKCATEVM